MRWKNEESFKISVQLRSTGARTYVDIRRGFAVRKSKNKTTFQRVLPALVGVGFCTTGMYRTAFRNPAGQIVL